MDTVEPAGRQEPGTGSAARTALLQAAVTELTEHGAGAMSLRAVARRAGLSHAAPQHFFGSRAGLLTAVAADGFHALAAALDGIHEADPRRRLSGLGRAYIDFGLAHPALFELMFRPGELLPDDPALQAAQARAIGALSRTAAELPVATSAVSPELLTLLSWALAHGLVALVRNGALRDAHGPDGPAAAESLAHTIAETLGALIGPGPTTRSPDLPGQDT